MPNDASDLPDPPPQRAAAARRGAGLVLVATFALWLGAGTGASTAEPRADGLAAALADASADPAPASYSARDLDWRDDARDRSVPAKLYLPQAASERQRVPLIVFSYGIGGSRNGYSYLGRWW